MAANTSFKVFINNFKSFTKTNHILRSFQEWGVPTGRLNKANRLTFGHLTFQTKEDAEKAIEIINEREYNGQKLKASFNRSFEGFSLKGVEEPSSMDENAQSLSESVIPKKTTADVVSPLWKMPYETQLEQKENGIKKVLSNIVSAMKKTETETKSVLEKWNIQDGLCCPFEGMSPSPIINYYRNKCDFTVGLNKDFKPVTGFQLGSFRNGIIVIGEPDECLNVSKEANQVAQLLTNFIRTKSCLPIFNKVTHNGFWRALTVRQGFRTGEVMAILQCKVENIDQLVVEQELNLFKDYVLNSSAGPSVTSLIFQEHNGASNAVSLDSKSQTLHGKTSIIEHMCGLNFQISPGAFFQVNTPAAELLYNKILDKANLKPDATFLDVCCGTGTIGLVASSRVKSVIGVELSAPAIEDAKHNMYINGIKNAEFICSKAETALPDILERHCNENLVAVVDPPRSGVHPNVSRALRAAKNIKRLVYVSCNPEAGLIQNTIELCRPSSSRFFGDPFVPVSASAVDLFPHTNHCEAIVVFERP